ncbi:MAG: glucosaminidase domain-containing protein [Lentihominibacter sp.]
MTSIEPVEFSDVLREEAVDYVFAREAIPAYSFAEVSALDVSKPSGVTVEDLKLVTRHNLVGLEEAFYKAEQDYGVNALFVLGIASHESAYGTYCFRPNNLFGYGRKGYSSKAECIDVVARGLANNYLRPGASLYNGNTINSVNKRYAADPGWDRKVAKKVAGFYQTISERHNSQLNKLR